MGRMGRKALISPRVFEVFRYLYCSLVTDPFTEGGKRDNCFSREFCTFVRVPFPTQVAVQAIGYLNLVDSVGECSE